MGDATDRLVYLARVRVRAHLAKRGKKIVPVVAYTRDITDMLKRFDIADTTKNRADMKRLIERHGKVGARRTLESIHRNRVIVGGPPGLPDRLNARQRRTPSVKAQATGESRGHLGSFESLPEVEQIRHLRNVHGRTGVDPALLTERHAYVHDAEIEQREARAREPKKPTGQKMASIAKRLGVLRGGWIASGRVKGWGQSSPGVTWEANESFDPNFPTRKRSKQGWVHGKGAWRKDGTWSVYWSSGERDRVDERGDLASYIAALRAEGFSVVESEDKPGRFTVGPGVPPIAQATGDESAFPGFRRVKEPGTSRWVYVIGGKAGLAQVHSIDNALGFPTRFVWRGYKSARDWRMGATPETSGQFEEAADARAAAEAYVTSKYGVLPTVGEVERRLGPAQATGDDSGFRHRTKEFNQMSKAAKIRHLREDHGLQISDAEAQRVQGSRTPAMETWYQRHITAHDDEGGYGDIPPDMEPERPGLWDDRGFRRDWQTNAPYEETVTEQDTENAPPPYSPPPEGAQASVEAQTTRRRFEYLQRRYAGLVAREVAFRAELDRRTGPQGRGFQMATLPSADREVLEAFRTRRAALVAEMRSFAPWLARVQEGRLMTQSWEDATAEPLSVTIPSVGAQATGERIGLPEGMRFVPGIGDAVPGGYNGSIVVVDANGKLAGYLDYQSASGDPTPTIAMVEVEPEHRRKGIARAMLVELRRQFPDAGPLDWGVMTEEGVALREGMGAQATGERRPTLVSVTGRELRPGDVIVSGGSPVEVLDVMGTPPAQRTRIQVRTRSEAFEGVTTLGLRELLTVERPREVTVADRRRFDSLQRQWAGLKERRRVFEFDVLLKKYAQVRPPRSWMTNAEVKRFDGIIEREHKLIDQMHELLDRISPRQWRSGVGASHPFEMPWEDAITRGPLSKVPAVAYGGTEAQVRAFAAALDSRR